MAEHVDDAMRRADEEIAALKRTKPSNAAEARVKSAELLRLQQVLLEASRQVVSANAAKRISNNGNGVEVVATNLSEEVLDALVKGIAGWVNPQLTAIEKRIAVIEQRRELTPLASRLAQLEQHAVKYEGIWDETKAYSAGTLVTFQGGMWYAESGSTGVRPGSGSSSWTLANKSRR